MDMLHPDTPGIPGNTGLNSGVIQSQNVCKVNEIMTVPSFTGIGRQSAWRQGDRRQAGMQQRHAAAV
jgi:hypothetical protein